jgi:antibiotic biosynthesis monooxygenase (ABM) superfamily enzyme
MAPSTTHTPVVQRAAPAAILPAPVNAPGSAATPAAPPSVHVRAAVTWLAIFPLVSIGMIAMAPFTESWHPVLRAFVLTLVVVPLAVYVVVPRLLHAHGRLVGARAARRADRRR